MPTADRRPRRRAKSRDTETLTIPELQEQARDATPADWDNGLRRKYVRALVERGLKPDEAAGVARAYERKPYLIPMRPPKGLQEH